MASSTSSGTGELTSLAQVLPTVEEVFITLEGQTQTLRDMVSGARRLLQITPRFLDEPTARAHAAACLSRLESALTEGVVFLHMANLTVQAQAELAAHETRKRIAKLRDDAQKAQNAGDKVGAAQLVAEAERLEAGVSQLHLDLGTGGTHG